jgi:hypothetical protein
MASSEFECFQNEWEELLAKRRAFRELELSHGSLCQAASRLDKNALRAAETSFRDSANLLTRIPDLNLEVIEEVVSRLGLRGSKQQDKRDVAVGLIAQGLYDAGQKELAIRTVGKFVSNEEISQKVREHFWLSERNIERGTVVLSSPIAELAQ